MNDEKEMKLALDEFTDKLKELSKENPEKLAAFLTEFEQKLDELQQILDEPDA